MIFFLLTRISFKSNETLQKEPLRLQLEVFGVLFKLKAHVWMRMVFFYR